MIDKSDQADPGADDTDRQRWRQRTFSPEVVERAHEEIRRQEAERRRRLFGDRQPFAVPEDIIDFDFEPEAGVPVDYALNTAAATDATGGRMSHERYYELSIAAARQQGFLTRAQLARLGVDDGELDRLREAGLLTELDHGVYQHAASSVECRTAGGGGRHRRRGHSGDHAVPDDPGSDAGLHRPRRLRARAPGSRPARSGGPSGGP
ncbi:type IV toxin-antitoxin system AbiEi family antitoxin domain-containing protein [Nonomuraea harbinensis]|uniref:Type IV toxin-antitoxin system AbiEi family antitoxin domain-containing protein n=1 Tax=Nonomuraea harbinensis TaxID=1286938 RepID=A0ABW1BNN8_9ACTN|nr:type IV toxin-antitoxin system AbiEi family antitoxin domain-containing protein [Nonomuraea harbinensis]